MKNFLLTIILLTSSWAMAENSSAVIKGKIKSSDGKPVAYVTVAIAENSRGTTAGEDGEFELLNIKPGTYTVEVSAVGLISQRKEVTVGASGTVELNFVLKEDARQLDNVIVNARRRLNQKTVSVGKAGIAPMDMPQSIATIDNAIIREQQAQRLSDVVKNVNGVYLGTTRGSTQETFFARGYGFGSGNMFKNGSRVNTGSMPEVSSLEKVEVLKGSASILYGNVAPGGIMNMVTKKPKFKFGGEVSMRAGSFDTYKPAFDVYGPLSKNIAYRVNGTYESANSYRDYVSSERFYVNPSFLFKLSDRTELVVEGDYLHHHFTPDFGIGSYDDNKINNVAGRNTFYGTPWQYATTQQATATANIKHRFNDNWTLTGNLSYQDYDRDYYSTERIQAAANGDWNRPLNRTTTHENYYVANVDVVGNVKTWTIDHKLLIGADADRYDATNYAYNQPKIYDKINLFDATKYPARTDIPPASKLTRTEIPTNRMGVYVQDLISLSAKWKVLAGVRWSIQETTAADSFYYATGKSTNGTAVKSDNAFSPRLGLVFKPWNTTSFFASYANSFTLNSGTDIYGNILPPSIIDQYELGVKNDFYDGRLSVNVTAYAIINHNLAQTAPYDKNGNPNNDTRLKQLVGETTSKGIEVDVAAQPINGLNLMAGYSYNDMRYTDVPVAVGNYIEGQRLVSTPAHTANATAFYTISRGKLQGVKFGAGVYYVGDRNAGWNNTWVAGTGGLPVAPTKTRLIPVEGFTTVDLSLGYTYKKVSVMTKVQNLTNTFNYYVHENYSINPIPPTQFIATVAYKF